MLNHIIDLPFKSFYLLLIRADKFSSWKSDSGESLGSLPDAKSPEYRRARTGSCTSRTSRNRAPVMAPEDLGAADNVVATLRLLVALEDYLGSLGPKIVDLLTEALKMEKVCVTILHPCSRTTLIKVFS